MNQTLLSCWGKPSGNFRCSQNKIHPPRGRLAPPRCTPRACSPGSHCTCCSSHETGSFLIISPEMAPLREPFTDPGLQRPFYPAHLSYVLHGTLCARPLSKASDREHDDVWHHVLCLPENTPALSMGTSRDQAQHLSGARLSL